VSSRLFQTYRVLAIVTGIGLVILTFVGIPLQVFSHDDTVVEYVGIFHGWAYILYVITTVLLAYARRWKPLKALLVVAAGTIPLAAFFAEHKVVKDERRAYEAAAASPAV
jgi:integral membrane protein